MIKQTGPAPAIMTMPGPTELLIVLGICALIFGTSRLSGIGKTIGTVMHDLRSAMGGDKEDDNS